MASKLLLLSISLFAIIGLFSQTANACGCGLAITDMEVFNALKETQAYLLIDVKDMTTYNEMPFFRFVSMDKPHNVTIVFPIDQIPYDVEGEKISAGDFLDNYGINKAEKSATKQSFSAFVNQVDKPIFALTNGLVLSFFYAVVQFSTSGIYIMGGTKSGSYPVAHFEFEGGTLDIYNVSSAQTLEEFVKTVNITLTEKVEELVTKYNDYYVAVLYLNVPSVIDENNITFLENCMPAGLQRIRDELSGTDATYFEMQQMVETEIAQSTCGPQGDAILRKYISYASYASENVNGTLVIMKFKDNSNFFYPTSIVGSYKYPITDQRYYIKVPDNLHVNLSSSDISKTTNVDGERWYKIETTKEDLKGSIVNADSFVKFQDALRKLVEKLHDNSFWILIIVYVSAISLPLILLRQTEKLTKNEMALAIGLYLAGGLLLTAIFMFDNKKKKSAFAFLGIWGLFLMVLVL